MEIKTKYDVGHTFWSPRSRTKYIQHQYTDDNGNVWTRDESEYIASAKHKQIVGIEISVDEENVTSFSYYVKNFAFSYYDKNFDNLIEHQYPSLYEEERINNYTEEEALAVARQYADRKEECYGY